MIKPKAAKEQGEGRASDEPDSDPAEESGFFGAITKAVRIVAGDDPGLSEKLRLLADLAVKQVSAQRGSIMITEEGETLVVRAATVPDILGASQSINDDMAASIAAREKHTVSSADPRSERLLAKDRHRGYKSGEFISHPIVVDGEAVGVINAADKTGGPFTGRDEAALCAFAGIISSAILGARERNERDSLKAAHEKLKELQRLREEAIGMIVHDLKGPAGEIAANLNILGDSVTGILPREALAAAESSAEELMDMIMNILDVYRMEEGKFQASIEKVDVVQVAREKTRKMRALASQENKTVSFETDVETWVTGADRGVLNRVFWNLLSNANNHTGYGSVINVKVRREGAGLRISIADNGSGIAAGDLEKIFEKFGRAGASRARYSTGLGLTYCKMAVEACGGRITVESEFGRGSVFHVFIP